MPAPALKFITKLKADSRERPGFLIQLIAKEMKIKQFLIKVLKIEVTPVYTINLADYNNSDYSKRASGRTTRLADMYIQLLFSTGRISVKDHYDSRQMSRYLLDIIVRRLQMEHQGVRFDIRENVITLIEQGANKRKFDYLY